MFRHIRTKLTILYGGLFAFALALIAVALYVSVTTAAERQVRKDLLVSSTVYQRLWQARARELGNAASVLARDFGFREAVATGDPGTAASALGNLKARLRLRVAFIVNIDGTVTGLADTRLQSEAAALWDPLDAGEMSGVATLGGVPHQVVAAPIMAPSLVGWLVFATELGADEMHGFERLSSMPINAAVFQRGRSGRWVTGHADGHRGDVPALARFIDATLAGSPPGQIDEVAGRSIARATVLKDLGGNTPAVLLLRYPLDLAMAPYRPLEIAVALTGLVGLLVLFVGSWRLSLSITRPISQLDHAAHLMEQGEMAEVPVTTSDEIGRLAESFNKMAAGIAERERRITELAFNDPLTGLPNRAFFRQHLAHELQQSSHRGQRLALLCLDLDNFKAVNDTLGHPTGDELLRLVAERLRHAAGDGRVARLGGDEFAIIVPNASSDIAALARTIMARVAEPLQLAGRSLAVSASIGIAFAPSDGVEADTLLKNAALALNQAKEEGRATCRFFEAEMNARAQERHQLETDLRGAIAGGQLELHYQPLFHLAEDRVCGFEALLRWNHPTRGRIPPLDFIPIAEETGLIVPIGNWVLQQACREAQGWPDHVRVAVNVSSVQFRKPGLESAVVQALGASGLDPARLEIEITESIFLESSETILAILHKLRALGVKIALDDFGTGYSSLGYLQSFPFDKIKIDRSFTEQILTRADSAAIVTAVTALARALGMEVTAEGVQGPDQIEQLRRDGCTSVQGFFLSVPVDAKSTHGFFEPAELRRGAA